MGLSIQKVSSVSLDSGAPHRPGQTTMYRCLLSLSFLASTIISSVYAIRIPVRRENVSVREGSHSISVTKNSQSRRNLTGFFNVRNGRYVGNITISGESFEVWCPSYSHEGDILVLTTTA